MKRSIGPLVFLAFTATAAHWAALHFAPSIIMDRALATLAKRNIALHAFTAPQRITPQTQAVVRSSPDLFYSLCRYDFTKVESGGLKVTMSNWPGYQSLSFFDDRTNNFATFRGTDSEINVILASPDIDNTTEMPSSPSYRGVVLIRRLAPTPELFEQAKMAAEGDACEPVSEDIESLTDQLR